MGKKKGSWREDILEAAQVRFERNFVAGTMKDIEKVRTRLERQSERATGQDATLRQKAIAADLKRLDGIQRKTQGILREAQRNFKAQLGGAGFEGPTGGGVATARQSGKKSSAK